MWDLGKFLQTPFLRNLRDLVATIRAIAFIAPALIGGLLLAYAILRRNTPLPSPFLILALALGWWLTLVGAWYYARFVSNPPFYKIVELEGVLKVERVNGHHRYTYTRKQTVKATRNELRLIEFRAHWTGSGSNPPHVEPTEADHEILDGKRPEQDGRVHRWLYPREPIGRGHTIKVGIRQIHEDDKSPQDPYFREGGGRYKTGKIKVTVRFQLPEDPQLRNTIEGRVWNSKRSIDQGQVSGSISYRREVNDDLGTVDYTVTCNRPKRFHSYGLAWTRPSRSTGDGNK
jgi:hypothetical protein